MSLRRTRFALLLVAAVLSMALSAAVDVADGGGVDRGGRSETSLGVRAARADASVARLTGEDRRDASSDRTLKHRLVFFAVLTVLLCSAHAAWKRLANDARRRRPVTSFWSPQSGRSPPASSLSIV